VRPLLTLFEKWPASAAETRRIATVSLILTVKKASPKLNSVATAKQKPQPTEKDSRVRATRRASAPTPASPSLKELFQQRDAAKPGSKEEDQAVDRIMEAMFPNSHGIH
jgi:hypothetical protein